MHFARSAERTEHAEHGRGYAPDPEQRHPLRQGRLHFAAEDGSQQVWQSFGGAWGAYARPHAAPELGLPPMLHVECRGRAFGAHCAVGVEPLRPLLDEAGSLGGVAVEQVGDAAGQGPPTGAGVRPAGHLDRGGGEFVEHPPGELGKTPRVAGRILCRGIAEGSGHELTGEDELDVGGDAVAVPGGPEPAAETGHRDVAQTDCRNHYEVGGERIRRGRVEHFGQRIEQGVELVGVVEVEHDVVNVT